jgi:hypothetical protein
MSFQCTSIEQVCVFTEVSDCCCCNCRVQLLCAATVVRAKLLHSNWHFIVDSMTVSAGLHQSTGYKQLHCMLCISTACSSTSMQYCDYNHHCYDQRSYHIFSTNNRCRWCCRCCYHYNCRCCCFHSMCSVAAKLCKLCFSCAQL